MNKSVMPRACHLCGEAQQAPLKVNLLNGARLCERCAQADGAVFKLRPSMVQPATACARLVRARAAGVAWAGRPSGQQTDKETR